MTEYSKVDNSPLYSVLYLKDVNTDRKDISPDTELLQVAAKKVSKGMSWPRHKHLPLERNTTGTQESWVIMAGKIKASLYDIDDSLYSTIELCAGDMVVVHNAGHALEVLEDNTILYEFKNGPYFGRTKDKVEF
jgi:hypothetical protein